MTRDLERHGVHTQARVIALTPENHGTIRYRFDVAGVGYEGSDQPPFYVTVGDSIPVTYLPTKPTTSTAGEPSIVRLRAGGSFLLSCSRQWQH